MDLPLGNQIDSLLLVVSLLRSTLKKKKRKIMKLFFKSFSDRFDVGVVSAIQRIFQRRCLLSLPVKSS